MVRSGWKSRLVFVCAGNGELKVLSKSKQIENKQDGSWSRWHFDHIFVAAHGEAMPALLPYDVAFDGDSSHINSANIHVIKV